MDSTTSEMARIRASIIFCDQTPLDRQYPSSYTPTVKKQCLINSLANLICRSIRRTDRPLSPETPEYLFPFYLLLIPLHYGGSAVIRKIHIQPHVTALLRKPKHAWEKFFGSDSIGRYPEAAAFFSRKQITASKKGEMEVAKCGRN
jgi:hypothetical protein